MAQEWFIPAKTGVAMAVNKGQIVRVIDVEGQQVADVVAYRRADYSEWFDPSVTMDVLRTYALKPNDVLYSNKYRPIFTITRDLVQRHDLLNSACRSEMYEFLYKAENHRSCYDNLNAALAKFDVPVPGQHYTFNAFMNTVLTPDGRILVKRPISKAGDYIELRAEMDLIVGVSACPCEESEVNGYRCTPIRVEIMP